MDMVDHIISSQGRLLFPVMSGIGHLLTVGEFIKTLWAPTSGRFSNVKKPSKLMNLIIFIYMEKLLQQMEFL